MHLSCPLRATCSAHLLCILALVWSFEKHDDCEWKNGKEEVVFLTSYYTTVFPEETEKSHDIFIWHGKCMIMSFIFLFNAEV
jgi:hypothetical protein